MLAMAESTDNTLFGRVDGINRLFVTSRPMRLDLPVSVYVNGMLRQAEVANGYELLSAVQLKMREAPMMGEEIGIMYLADAPPVALDPIEMPDVSARLVARPPQPWVHILQPVPPVATVLP